MKLWWIESEVDSVDDDSFQVPPWKLIPFILESPIKCNLESFSGELCEKSFQDGGPNGSHDETEPTRRNGLDNSRCLLHSFDSSFEILKDSLMVIQEKLKSSFKSNVVF